jgi:5'-deoxynucleotidase YfbR-like HD superfamily hydrolase
MNSYKKENDLIFENYIRENVEQETNPLPPAIKIKQELFAKLKSKKPELFNSSEFEEYVNEAEKMDGIEYWINYFNPANNEYALQELIEDIDLYLEHGALWVPNPWDGIS